MRPVVDRTVRDACQRLAPLPMFFTRAKARDRLTRLGDPDQILERLVVSGYADTPPFQDAGQPVYTLTEPGRRYASKRMRPISERSAAGLVAGICDRAAATPDDPRIRHTLTALTLVGSYAGPPQDQYGDVDIVLETVVDIADPALPTDTDAHAIALQASLWHLAVHLRGRRSHVHFLPSHFLARYEGPRRILYRTET